MFSYLSHFRTLIGLAIVTATAMASFVCRAQLQEKNIYLKRSSNGQTEVDLYQLQQVYNMNQEIGIKNYLPQNITAKDDNSQIAQKFFAQALDQFERQRMQFKSTIQALNSLTKTSSTAVGRSGVQFEMKIAQGKTALVHRGFFESALSFTAGNKTVQMEMTKRFQNNTKITLTQLANSEQVLSRIGLAYEF